MVYGSDGNTTIPHLIDPYPGTDANYICANVVWKVNGIRCFPPIRYGKWTVSGLVLSVPLLQKHGPWNYP